MANYSTYTRRLCAYTGERRLVKEARTGLKRSNLKTTILIETKSLRLPVTYSLRGYYD